MKPVKDREKVTSMFAQGQTDLVDPKTGYRYSMVARCPKDGSDASVARIEKERGSLSRVIFECTSCSAQFEAGQDDIYVC